MKNNKEKIFIFFYSLVLFLTGIFLGCLYSAVKAIDEIPQPNRDISPIPMQTGTVEAGIKAEDFNFETRIDDKRKWNLHASSVRMDQDQQLAYVESIICNYYEDEKQIMILKSKNAEVDILNKNVRFKNQVEVKYVINKAFMKVDDLYLDSKEKVLIGEGKVRFFRGNNMIKADKIKGDINLKVYELEGNILMVRKIGKREGR